VFYGDVRTNAIRYGYPEFMLVKVLAGMPIEDSSGESAGYKDGDGAAARFNAPLAVAARPDGTIAVADAGNRRIRLVHVDPAAELAQAPALLPSPAPSSTDYSIVMLGNSFTWYDSVGSDSIAGLLQRQLATDRVLGPQKPLVRYIGFASWDAAESQFATLAELGLDKVVVMQLEFVFVSGAGPDEFIKHPAAWHAQFVEHLRECRKILAAAHIHFVVMLHPLETEMSPNEVFGVRFGVDSMIPYAGIHKLLLDAIVESGVDYVDTYPDFRGNAISPTSPLSLLDGHLNINGREILIGAFVRGLEKLKPWAQTHY
jgi:hypothetical protein